MGRVIPGSIGVDGREFFYIEIYSGDRFATLLDDEQVQCADIALPQSGGAIEEKVRIRLPDTSIFLSISYKGDILGWRNRFVEFCKRTNRRWGTPRKEAFFLSDNSSIAFADCDILFEA